VAGLPLFAAAGTSLPRERLHRHFSVPRAPARLIEREARQAEIKTTVKHPNALCDQLRSAFPTSQILGIRLAAQLSCHFRASKFLGKMNVDTDTLRKYVDGHPRPLSFSGKSAFPNKLNTGRLILEHAFEDANRPP
jgi:hypothetical protein